MRIGDFRETYAADEALLKTPPARAWMGALIAALALFPFVAGDYPVYLANLVGITAISALGLNLLTGFTGQISLGHAAFMGLGAYTVAILSTRFQLPMLLTLPLAGAVAALAGVVVGAPSLRIKGLYLAMATLAAHFVVEFTVSHWDSMTGGVNGISIPPAQLAGFAFDSDRRLFYLIMPLTVLLAFFAKNLFRTKVGKAFIAIRDHDISARPWGSKSRKPMMSPPNTTSVRGESRIMAWG